MFPSNHQGYERSLELYERALRTIPLATQTFSKSAQNFVKGASPMFLERGDGCKVWDVDRNEFFDYILGLLPVVLGYRDPDVDAAILDQLAKGISFSLATELEIELAELLVDIIPSAEMVRFAKNGSDVTSGAVRLARAVTGRDLIAVCGYHGWHDWYIGTTTRDLGVPSEVKALTKTFAFNSVEELEQLFEAYGDRLAAIVLEPIGAGEPTPEFLSRLRSITEEHGALLVFDEIVSGFRAHLGGAQQLYDVKPDLTCVGKAMGNGMPISALVGRRQYMEKVSDIFFSGTFGGEALSLAAAIATIRKLQALDIPKKLNALGCRLKERINNILEIHELQDVLSVSGHDWSPRFTVAPKERSDFLLYTSLFRQQAIANGLLMGNGLNLCYAHVGDVERLTIEAFDGMLGEFAQAIRSKDPAGFLRGAVIEPIFKVR